MIYLRRLIAVTLFAVFFPVFVHADGFGGFLRQDTASQVEIMALLVSSNQAATTTGSIPGGFTFALTTQSDTGIPYTTTWTPTAFGGGTHDAYVSAVGKLTWTVELTAADVTNRGRAVLCWHYPSAKDDCKDFEVISQTDYDALVGGNLADTGPILTAIGALDTLKSGTAYPGYPVFIHRTGAAQNVGVTAATLTCTWSKYSGSWTAFSGTGISGVVEIGNGDYSIDLAALPRRAIVRCVPTGGSAPGDIAQQFIYAQE